VRKFTVCLLGFVLFVFIGASSLGTPNPITYRIYPEGDHRAIEVKTALASYVFSEDGGTLKSLYLYFAPYGSRVAELVPGTKTDAKTLTRQYPVKFLFSVRDKQQIDQIVQELKKGNLPQALKDEFSNNRVTLSAQTSVKVITDKKWRIVSQGRVFTIKLEDKRLNIYLSTVFPFTVQTEGKTGIGHYTLSPPSAPSADELLIEFTGTLGGLRITKRFILHNSPYYNADFTLKIENPSGEPVPLSLILGAYTPNTKGPSLVYEFDGRPSPAPLAPGSYTSFDGLGLMDKATVYFLKTSGQPGVEPFIRPLGARMGFGITLSAAPGKSSYSFSLYGGRRRYLLMNAVGLGGLDNPGSGARLIIPVVQFLEWLYRYTGNYGWAIILFTLITRLVLFPLMRKQYHSMAKMQRLQPKLQEIQKRFKDDRQLLQQKMMELYKREGVNPMGGCLPLLIQLPILILLWKAILYASEAIHFSPGFLWIPDLSLRDPYFILVILTTGVMILQQRLMTPMTTEASGSQKYMGYLFPIIMAFFFWNFPAGLWLYYLLTTLSQVGQQAFVNRELAKAEAGSAAPKVARAQEDSQDGDGQGGD